MKLLISSFINIQTIKYKMLYDISIFVIIYISNVVNDNLVFTMKSSISKVMIPEKEAN
jgi:hypothetical protein